MEPRKNYSNSEKFMRGVEKVRASWNPCYYQWKYIMLFTYQLGDLYGLKKKQTLTKVTEVLCNTTT